MLRALNANLVYLFRYQRFIQILYFPLPVFRPLSLLVPISVGALHVVGRHGIHLCRRTSSVLAGTGIAATKGTLRYQSQATATTRMTASFVWIVERTTFHMGWNEPRIHMDQEVTHLGRNTQCNLTLHVRFSVFIAFVTTTSNRRLARVKHLTPIIPASVETEEVEDLSSWYLKVRPRHHDSVL
jgi:hypothetical protein